MKDVAIVKTVWAMVEVSVVAMGKHSASARSRRP